MQIRMFIIAPRKPKGTVVVGGRGFLGRAIVAELTARGDKVTVFDRTVPACNLSPAETALTYVSGDLANPDALAAAFERADEVYHRGGRLGTSELESDVRGAIDANITGTINVFEAALAAGVPAVFYPSKPNVWLNTYTITKYAAEQFATLYNADYPIRICSLRLFNAYGPGQALTSVRKIIPTFAAQALLGKPLSVYGDGRQTVDMIYSEDIARIAVDFTRSGYKGAPIDCGRGVALSVTEVAEAVDAHFGNRSGIQFEPMRRGETEGTHLVANTAPVRGVLGSVEFASWERSLAKTLDWYAALDRSAFSAAAAFA
jgi:nucleoside-diphosphate-sugar epimerase